MSRAQGIQRKGRRPVAGWNRAEGFTWTLKASGGRWLRVERIGGEGVLIEWEAKVDGEVVGREGSFWAAMLLAEDEAT